MFSILIPYYNHKNYIIDALDSLIVSKNLIREIIIVDDGSSDEGHNLINNYDSPISEKIILSRQINQGVHIAINNAFKISKSKYIAILNSDDIFLPSKLEKSFKFMNEDSIDLIWGRIKFINKSGLVLGKCQRTEWYSDGLEHFFRYNNPVAGLIHENIVATSSNIVVNSSLFERVGGFRAFRYASDLDFILMCLSQINVKFQFENSDFVGYRYHDTNTILESVEATKADVEKIAMDLIPFFVNHQPQFIGEFLRAAEYRGLKKISNLLNQ